MIVVAFWAGVVVGFLMGVILIAVLAGNESPIERANDDNGSERNSRHDRRHSRRVGVTRYPTGPDPFTAGATAPRAAAGARPGGPESATSRRTAA